MASIIVRINSMKLDNINEEMAGRITQYVEQATKRDLVGDGYDYMGRTDLGVFFQTDDPVGQIPELISILEKNEFDGSSLKGCFKIMVSSEQAPTDYYQVYPERNRGAKADFWKGMFSGSKT